MSRGLLVALALSAVPAGGGPPTGPGDGHGGDRVIDTSIENPPDTGTPGDGWLARYGIDAVVHEFNCNWIAGLNDYPSAHHWRGTARGSRTCSTSTSRG